MACFFFLLPCLAGSGRYRAVTIYLGSLVIIFLVSHISDFANRRGGGGRVKAPKTTLNGKTRENGISGEGKGESVAFLRLFRREGILLLIAWKIYSTLMILCMCVMILWLVGGDGDCTCTKCTQMQSTCSCS